MLPLPVVQRGQHIAKLGAHAVGILGFVPDHEEVDASTAARPPRDHPEAAELEHCGDLPRGGDHFEPGRLPLVRVQVQQRDHRRGLAGLDGAHAPRRAAVEVLRQPRAGDALLRPGLHPRVVLDCGDVGADARRQRGQRVCEVFHGGAHSPNHRVSAMSSAKALAASSLAS